VADRAVHDDLDTATVRETFHGLTGQELGWLASMAATDRACVGAHAHVLDIAGHLYAERPVRLREWYHWVDEQVGHLRERVDRLLVLSDHGMQTTAVDDAEPGRHAWRAYVAADGLEGRLPDSVFDVADWLAERRGAAESRPHEPAEMDTPTATLDALGYLDA